MKKLLTIGIIGLMTVFTACQSNQPKVVYVQSGQPQVAVQQEDVAYADPQYANQPPVMYNYNGTNILIDAALMAYLYNNHINPGYYYSTHRNYNHFHVYSNGHYSGLSGTPRYVTSTSYHYVAPNPRYVTKRGAPDMRYKANRPIAPATARTYDLRKPSSTPSAPKTYSLRKSSSSSSSSKSYSLRKH